MSIASPAAAGLAAYRATAAGEVPSIGIAPTGGGGGTAAAGSFGNVLQQAVGNAVDMARTADRQSTAGMTGQASVTDVVLAVSRAEVALQTTVALRDRIVAAYQEVMRMPL
jgi:flagellar hook-basal body complex protein FliE